MANFTKLILFLVFMVFIFLIYDAESASPSLKDIADKEQVRSEISKLQSESIPEGPYDKFNRGTPRSSLIGLGKAMRAKDYALATNYLDLRNLPFSQKDEQNSDEELAEKLLVVAKRAMTIDIEGISNNVGGDTLDGLPSYRDRITTIKTKDGDVDILMQRVPRGDGVFIWKISNATMAIVPQLNDEFGYGKFGERLSEIFPSYVIGGLEIWQIVLLLGLLLVGYILATMVIFVFIQLISLNKSFKKERVKKFIVGPLKLLLVIIFMRATFDVISPSLVARAIFEAKTGLILAILWGLLGLINFIMARIAEKMAAKGQKGAVVLLKPASTIIKTILILIAGISWADNLGLQVTALITGLGVGGLAFALAAQKSMEDLIGAIIIYASRPVQIGDLCKFGTTVGTVEEIGLRATKLRTVARSVVHIPNSIFASGAIENLSQRDQILYSTRLNISYSNSADKLKALLSALRELIDTTVEIDEERSRVRFLEFSKYSQEVELHLLIKTNNFAEYLEHREAINMNIIDIVERLEVELVVLSAGLELA